ncbi:MAG: glycosyltransferase family 4 protein [Ruminococcus sp.]|nr:glycosyltransferase family 4 protein [Ruminococcus sp.]
MKIAMLGHKRIPSREGGIEVVVEQLAVRMARLGCDVTCYNRRGHHVSGKEFDSEISGEYKGIRLVSVPTVDKKGLAAVTSSFFAAAACAFGKYDAVHFHGEGSCAAMWLPKLFGKRCIATIHGLDWQRAKWSGFAGKYILWGEKTAVHLADEIIVLSRDTQNYFTEKYHRRTVYIPNGACRPEKRNADIIAKEYGLYGDDYILFLGRLVPEKGADRLIEAYKKLHTDKKLVIAGGSSDTFEYSRSLGKLAVNDSRIIFTGFVSGRRLEELFSCAYIYCLPSELEGMPLSLLEAMSYGCCCLISDIPQCTEAAEDKAAVYRLSEPDGLRNALQRLCDDPEEVNKYKAHSADFICGKYDWDDVVKKTVKLYKGE